jgi:predicted HNH restriction endonuclease
LENVSIEEEYVSSRIEGARKMIFSPRYERNPKNREDAIKLHGVTCMACGFNFREQYGDHGTDYIHVHHNQPLHSLDGPMEPDPQTDLEVVCPNCHAMIHRDKSHTLSLDELKKMISVRRSQKS